MLKIFISLEYQC